MQMTKREWKKMNKEYRFWIKGLPHVLMIDPQLGTVLTPFEVVKGGDHGAIYCHFQ